MRCHGPMGHELWVVANGYTCNGPFKLSNCSELSISVYVYVYVTFVIILITGHILAKMKKKVKKFM